MDTDLQEDLNELECPFNWDLKKLMKLDQKREHKEWDINDEDVLLMEDLFTKRLISAFYNIVNQDYDASINDLQYLEPLIAELKRPIEKDVARHIFLSTKAHILMTKKENVKKVEEIVKSIEKINDEVYLTSLYTFKALVFSRLRRDDSETSKIAIKFAKIVIKRDPTAAIAHLILGKHLRRIRRLITVFSTPYENELFHFKKAYELDKNPKFALFFAQCLKESNNKKEALIIFEKIFDMKLKAKALPLRLALAFIQSSNLDKAKKCLDYVESISPDKSMFLHYKGLYLMKMKEFEEASKCLLKATEVDHNFQAVMCYIECLLLLKKPFDFTSYLFKIKDEFADCENSRRKEICFHIAFSYFYYDKNYQESMKYFLLAFEIEAELPLKNFRCRFTEKFMNIYLFVMKDLLPALDNGEKNKDTLSKEVNDAKEKLTKICRPHLPYRPPMFRKRQS